ncbi:hypothetical protein FRC16_004172 [Serendipita sp. 398]|nr:hypothetical protein FRC16_004172 [Serendipita sp. 398]
MSEEKKSLEQQIAPPQDEPLGIDTEAHSGRDRSTSDAHFPPNPPPSSPHGAIVIPFSLPAPPFSEEGDTSFSRSIDAILATQTEREVAEECVPLTLSTTLSLRHQIPLLWGFSNP